jgi:hypothetical protein
MLSISGNISADGRDTSFAEFIAEHPLSAIAPATNQTAFIVFFLFHMDEHIVTGNARLR